MLGRITRDGRFKVTAASADVSASALALVERDVERGVTRLQETVPDLPNKPFRVILHDSRAALPESGRPVGRRARA